jgi:hypothetical protein
MGRGKTHHKPHVWGNPAPYSEFPVGSKEYAILRARENENEREFKDEDWWKIYGQVISPQTHKPSRLGGPSAYKAILLLLKNSPKSQVHKKRIEHMAKNTTRWGRKMIKLLETHF